MNLFGLDLNESIEIKKFRAALLASCGIAETTAAILNRDAAIWAKQFQESMQRLFGTLDHDDLQNKLQWLQRMETFRISTTVGQGEVYLPAPSVKRKVIRGF